MRVTTCALLALAASCTPEPRASRPRDTAAARPARDIATIRREGNRLVDEPSPYLQQHAHNPVDWYPWGEEALAAARESGKPILLSIGYATCHWCHVMEEESFEDDEVARYLNANFVAIKVDREQRPDLDALYLDAVRQLGGPTGWPLTVFLTPDLAPIFGGTYFPRERTGGRPGFLEVAREIAQLYEARGADAAARGRVALRNLAARVERLGDADAPVTEARVATAMARLAPSRDPQLGGFGRRQKFPNAPLLLAELRFATRTGDAASRGHVEATLERMMRGGIRDHLAGDFHRYTVDRAWRVPHFEKTLYDNAQLAQLFVEAGRALRRPDFVAVGREVLDALLARWQRPDGGLVVGFDADDPRGEGAYYTWTPDELAAAGAAGGLDEADAARLALLYQVSAPGEPSLEGRSVLHRLDDGRARAATGLSPDEARALLARARPALREARRARPAPAVDDKELAGWNGLALMSLATVGRWLDEPRYVAAAQRVARFLLERLWDEERAVMRRGTRAGASLGDGFLDDYALPILGLLRLHAADGDPRWLLAARRLGEVVVERFHDAERAALLHVDRDREVHGLPLRRPDLDDGVLPSGGAAAALALIELGAMTGLPALRDVGVRAARAAAPRAEARPFQSGYLLVALDHLVGESREVVIAGEGPGFEALLEVVRPSVPARVLPLRVGPGGAGERLARGFPALASKSALDGVATAFVCEIGRCELPATSPSALRAQLAPVLASPLGGPDAPRQRSDDTARTPR